jgi:hypothetical protein
MRPLAPAAVLLLAACATLPPLRPADPSQAVANEKSAATAFAEGVRIVVRPGAWEGGGDVEQVLTPVEVGIHNGSGRAVQVRPASFSLLVPGGFRYDALSPGDVRRALGPARGSAYGVGYAFAPWGPPFYAWSGPYGGWWGWGGFGPSPWWGPVLVYGRPGAARIPSEALTKGTLEPGGDATILLFFPVPAENLDALELDARLSDASGQKLPELRVPFVREGRHAVATPLPPTARPQAPAPPPPEPGAPPQPGTWQTLPPQRPPPPPPGPQETPPPQQPPVDAPVGPPVPTPDAAPRPQ